MSLSMPEATPTYKGNTSHAISITKLFFRSRIGERMQQVGRMSVAGYYDTEVMKRVGFSEKTLLTCYENHLMLKLREKSAPPTSKLMC